MRDSQEARGPGDRAEVAIEKILEYPGARAAFEKLCRNDRQMALAGLRRAKLLNETIGKMTPRDFR